MAEEEVRSERPSLTSLGEALVALKEARREELPELLLLIAELYADVSCRCEEKLASFGEGSGEEVACHTGLRGGRQELLDAFGALAGRL